MVLCHYVLMAHGTIPLGSDGTVPLWDDGTLYYSLMD